MNYKEAVSEIVKVIPQSKKDFSETYISNNPYMVINTFLRYIKKSIQENNNEVIQQYFQKMNDLYEKGDAALKNAVENVFIYSLDSLTFSCKAVRRQEIFSMLSLSLNKKYLHQVYKSGL